LALPRSWRGPSRLLTLTYLAGVGFGLVWLLLGYGGLAWLALRSIEPSAATLALYASLSPPGRTRSPRLRVSARVSRPVLLGLFRTTILIPVDLDAPGA